MCKSSLFIQFISLTSLSDVRDMRYIYKQEKYTNVQGG